MYRFNVLNRSTILQMLLKTNQKQYSTLGKRVQHMFYHSDQPTDRQTHGERGGTIQTKKSFVILSDAMATFGLWYKLLTMSLTLDLCKRNGKKMYFDLEFLVVNHANVYIIKCCAVKLQM